MSRKSKGLEDDFYLVCLGQQNGGEPTFFWAEGPFEKVGNLDSREPLLVLSEFWDSNPSLYRFKKFQILNILELKKKLREKISECLGSNFENLPRAGEVFEKLEMEISQNPEALLSFKENFQKSMNLLNEGTLEKIVPWVSAQCEMEKGSEGKASLSLFSLFLDLLNNFQFSEANVSYPYAFSVEGQGMLGVSPEFLLKSDEGYKFQSLALAGTSHSKDTDELLKREKDLSEHGFVVQDICDRLKRIVEVSELNVGATLVWQSGLVKHLRTVISFNLDPNQASRVLRDLHPTAALGGFPRGEILWKTLKSFENHIKRKFFGAPVGLLGVGKLPTLVLVAIRGLECVKTAGTHFWVQSSGCGIVRSSTLEKEWAELALKRSAVRRFWGLA